VPMEDRNERRRRELEEILELRRSFGTLGRRLVTRHTPIRTGLGPTVVPLGAESAKADPDADARPRGDQEPELDQHQEPDQELEPEPVPEPDQELEPEPKPEPVPVPVPVQDQKPELEPEPEPEPVPVLEPVQDQKPELDQDWDQVSTTVRRIAPIVDESYRVQAAAAPGAGEPFRIPEPPAARRRLPWLWLVALVAIFALGMAVDRVVVQPSAKAAPPASSQAAPAPSAPPTSAAPAGPQVSVPESCLATARRADALIHLLVKRTRGIELTKAFQAYTVASQTCRKEASSR
jgi:hypothetical protein